MKDKYFGDINDYRKYGLLRALAEPRGLKIGMCWLRTAPDGRQDGEARRYLEQPEQWRHRDPSLYDSMRRLSEPGVGRSVVHAETWSLIPGATYFHSFIADAAADREQYFRSAFTTLSQCHLIFFDPDNGMEVPSVRYGGKRSSKYLYWHELTAAFARGHSVLVYQHFPRVVRRYFVQRMVAGFQEELSVRLVYSFETARVVFFGIPRPEHEAEFGDAVKAIEDQWADQIIPVQHENIVPLAGSLNGAIREDTM